MRFHRPLEDWRAALECMEVRSRGRNTHRVFLFSRLEKPLAYALLHIEPGHGREEPEVGEFAGCRATLLEGLPAAAAALEAPALRLRVPDFDTPLSCAASRKGLSGEEGFLLHHTVKVTSPENLTAQLRGLLEERLGRGGSTISLRAVPDGTREVSVAGEHIILESPEFTRLVFGGPDGRKGPGEYPEVLDRIFPVPLPFPGLNYV